jgi:predicted MFS family arabinose efflux permease
VKAPAPFASDTPAVRELAPLVWLALGTFATGTESFMIAALLPGLSSDLAVSVTAAGQLMTVFALTYALSSPVLAAATAGIERRKLLLAAMAAFALANFVAASAATYWQLMAARVLLAGAAGLYVPSASALASAVVSPQRRGMALAIVMGGTSSAVALGVPLGAIIGHAFGWRATFVGVGILATVAIGGLAVGLPRGVGASLAVPTLRERIAVVRRLPVLVGLLITTLWATGAYTMYTYLAPYLAQVTGVAPAQVGLVLFVWGLAAVMGIFGGGALTDRIGARAVIPPALTLLALALATLSVGPHFLTGHALLVVTLVAIATWGVAGWGFFPSQQARLLEIGGLGVAPIALSLNASFMYLGFSLGAALGSLTLLRGSLTSLGWVGALCEVAALAAMWLATSRSSARAGAAAACPVPLHAVTCPQSARDI